MTKTETLLRELIALPSVNPAFAPAGSPRSGERRVAEFLMATAAQAGLDVDLVEVLPGRFNILAVLTPPGRVKQRILLAPHIDTVDAEDFTPKLRGGRIYGRGATDTKGSVAAMVSALMTLAKSPKRPASTEIVFAGLIDEENAQAGSRALVKSGLKADLAIVGEPTDLQIVTAHKGSIWFEIETQGKAAHGARPDLGVNAVHAMAKIVDALETEYTAQLTKRRHPLLGCSTFNTGVISGGKQPNIVPDRCMATCDRRTLPGETERSVISEMQALLKRHGLRATIRSVKQAPCPPMETDPRLPMIERFLSLAHQSVPVGVDYFCDAAVLAEAGIPGIVFGPGRIAQAHTRDEWISCRSLNMAEALLVKFFQSLP